MNTVTTLQKYTPDQIELIKRTIAKGASDDELALFMGQCERTGLDPFSRQIYLVPRRSKNKQTQQWETTYQSLVSIDGFRVIAERSNKYAGQVGPYWCGDDGKWVDVWLEQRPPKACRVGVLRSDFREPLWGVALFKSYAQCFDDGNLMGLWAKMPDVMIAKCAEALGLRKAFPNDLSGLYTGDEMAQAGVVEEKTAEVLGIDAPHQQFNADSLRTTRQAEPVRQEQRREAPKAEARPSGTGSPTSAATKSNGASNTASHSATADLPDLDSAKPKETVTPWYAAAQHEVGAKCALAMWKEADNWQSRFECLRDVVTACRTIRKVLGDKPASDLIGSVLGNFSWDPVGLQSIRNELVKASQGEVPAGKGA